MDYEKDTFYKAKRISYGATVIVSYKVVPNEKGITVTLTQDVLQAGKPMQYKGFLGRMSDNLYGIQKKVINTKEGIVEPKMMKPLFSPKKK